MSCLYVPHELSVISRRHREGGIGELYTYLPQLERNKERLLVVPPKSIQHPDYGFSVGRGAFRLVPGRWIRITQRVKMNDLFKENGMSGVFIDLLRDSQRFIVRRDRDIHRWSIRSARYWACPAHRGRSRRTCTGAAHSDVLRWYVYLSPVRETQLRGVHLGHSQDWASPKDQRAWFANISGAILRPPSGHDEL